MKAPCWLSGVPAQTGGRSDISLPISHEGKPFEARLNPRFVADILKTLDREAEVRLGFTKQFATVRSGDDFLGVVSTLNTQVQVEKGK